MAAGGAANLRREAEQSVVQLAELAPNRVGENGTAPFNALRKVVLHAASGREGPLDEVLRDLEPKDKVLANLIIFHDEKRIYRKQVTALLTVLLQVDSWKAALLADPALCARLPDEVRAIVPGAGGGAPEAGEAASVEAAEAPGSAAGGAVEEREAVATPHPATAPPGASLPIPVQPGVAAAGQASDGKTPKAAAGAGAGAITLTPAQSEALVKELNESVRQISCLDEGADGAQAFNLLRLSVGKAARTADAGSALLQDLEPKLVVLNFLVVFFSERRMYRKQIAVVLQSLLQARGWLRTLRESSELMAKLPEELRHIEAHAVEPPDPEPELVAQPAEAAQPSEPPAGPSADEHAPAADPAPVSFTLPEDDVSVTFSELMRSSKTAPVSNDEVKAAIKAAHERVARMPTGGARQRESLRSLQTAMMRIHLLSLTQASPASAASDDAIAAFESFRRATVAATAAELNELEPKETVIQFLLFMSKAMKKYRSRISATVILLMRHDKWRAFVEEDPQTQEAVKLLIEEPGVVKMGDGTALNVKKKAAEVMASNGAGVLVVRVIAGHNLTNREEVGVSDPYVRVTLGSKSKVTNCVCDDLNPVWKAGPFVFDVPRGFAEVRFEVLDKNYRPKNEQDVPMGFLVFKAASTPEHLGQGPKRHKLLGVEHGELEIEMAFEGIPEEEQKASALDAIHEGHDNNAGVVTALEQAISALANPGDDGDAVVIFDHQELRCPKGHPITKKKEGLRWHQSLEFWVQQRCNLCGDAIPPTHARWRCYHHCDFDVCQACYDEAHFRRSPRADQGSFTSTPSGPSNGSAIGSTIRSSSFTSLLRMASGGSTSDARGRTNSATRADPRGASPRTTDPRSNAQPRLGLPTSSWASTSNPPPDGSFNVGSISIPKEAIYVKDSIVFYGVDVTPERPGEPWRVLRRYNDFSHLADRLGQHAKTFPDAPFPGKHLFACEGDKLEERRNGLEVWLHRVLKRRPVPLVWVKPLKDFLHPDTPGKPAWGS